jgi:hypothetical protein
MRFFKWSFPAGFDGVKHIKNLPQLDLLAIIASSKDDSLPFDAELPSVVF